MSGINGYPGFISNFPRGHTKKFVIEMARTVQDPAFPEDPTKKIDVPVDLTDCKFYITIDEDQDTTTDPLIEIIIDPPTDPLNGKTLGVITDTQTFALEAGRYYYSVRFVNPGGEAFVIDMGKIKVHEAVSPRIE